MRKIFLLSALILTVLFYNTGCKSKKPVDQTIAYAGKDAVWSDFRREFRYHMQTIGVTQINDDKSVTLIISEPPPHVTVKELKERLGKLLFFIEEKTNKIGYDGWVKDLVVVISGINEKKLEELKKDLNKYLYFTDYKYYTIDLSVKSRAQQFVSNLNYKIQASELNQWFVSDKEKFYPQDDNNVEFSLDKAVTYETSGILYSKNPGFVGWIFKENSNISNDEVAIRTFCMDADLILGAVKNENGYIIIIGRERLSDLYALPPLRTETIKMLASANKEELSQSYERMSLFAGKMSGGKDWAPIYLSSDLLNTEYGSLLNITDQMLKSWSSNGGVDYTDFNYTKPSYFSFAKSIRDVINTRSLTYNWNTKGVGYTIEGETNEFYCINRTGSLPVTYIPQGLANYDKSSVNMCEKRAYDYFSWLGNPDLARVVQYASIYQIFSKYNITADNRFYSPTEVDLAADNTHMTTDTMTALAMIPGVISSPLKSRVVDLLNEIRGWDDEKLELVADRMLAYRDFSKVYSKDELIFGLESFQLRVEEYLTDYSVDQFAGYVVNPREIEILTSDDYLKSKAAADFTKSANLLWNFILPDVTTEGLRDEYVRGREDYFSRWIKTASVVVSWDKDSAMWQGGHNLGAKVTPFKVSKDVAKGEIRVIEENGIKKILIAEEDISNIDPAVLRTIANDGDNIPEHLFIDDISYKPRAVDEVLPQAGNRVGRGLADNHIHVKEITEGFTINGKHVENCDELVQELTGLAKNNEIENLQVHFESMDKDRAKALLKSSEIKLTGHEINSTRMLKSGEIFNIGRVKYDFKNAKVISDLVDNEIVIEIPQILNTKSRARFSITGFIKATKNKIINKINSLLGRARETDINFYKTLIDELKEYDVKPENIIIEIDDCIICLKLKTREDGAC